MGWSGFATPRLLERYPWPRAGLVLGVVWAAWHGLADYYWGGAVHGPLWGLHFLEWVAALAAFRVLMTWVYAGTRSLLLGVLLHASFTGSQVLLWPAARPAEELLWYGLFACALSRSPREPSSCARDGPPPAGRRRPHDAAPLSRGVSGPSAAEACPGGHE